jgi:hypothetical protein
MGQYQADANHRGPYSRGPFNRASLDQASRDELADYAFALALENYGFDRQNNPQLPPDPPRNYPLKLRFEQLNAQLTKIFPDIDLHYKRLKMFDSPGSERSEIFNEWHLVNSWDNLPADTDALAHLCMQGRSACPENVPEFDVMGTYGMLCTATENTLRSLNIHCRIY